jgi:DNA-binding transcriptional MerR regulator
MTDDGTGLLTIGRLAGATGLTVRTIRYWSDEGVLPPVARSAGGYRLYDAASVARLELIHTLRELGLGLEDVHHVLAGERTVAEVAATHVAALDAQIRSLKVTRAVLSSVARRGSTAEEMTLLNRLARLSAAERQRIMTEFVAETLHGLDTGDPGDPGIRERMRALAADLVDDPTPEQVDAWVELAEMLQDPGVRAQLRRAVECSVADDRAPDAPRGRAAAGGTVRGHRPERGPGPYDGRLRRAGRPLPRTDRRREPAGAAARGGPCRVVAALRAHEGR